jgi:hypothetical protein
MFVAAIAQQAPPRLSRWPRPQGSYLSSLPNSVGRDNASLRRPLVVLHNYRMKVR